MGFFRNLARWYRIRSSKESPLDKLLQPPLRDYFIAFMDEKRDAILDRGETPWHWDELSCWSQDDLWRVVNRIEQKRRGKEDRSKPLPVAARSIDRMPTKPRANIRSQYETVTARETNQPQAIECDDGQKLARLLLGYSSIRFIGNQGSGKTSKAYWLIEQKLTQGHEVWWFDPDIKAIDIQRLKSMDVQIFGAGGDYEDIDRGLRLAIDMVNDNYDRRAKDINYVAPAMTIVLDELTSYDDHCKHSGEFTKTSLQRFSKLNIGVVLITHNDTLSCMGGKAGTKAMYQNTLLDLKLSADPTKGNRVPKEYGELRLPGSSDWETVKIPKWLK